METKFKDVAHLYLGGNVQVEYNGRIGNVFTYYHPAGKFNADTVWVCSLEEEGNEKMSCNAPVNEVKPILRPLSDISEQELNEWADMNGYDLAKEKKPLSEVHQSVVNGIKKEGIKFLKVGESEIETALVFFKWALSKSFDLFNLIPSGQAIDKTTLSN